MISRIQGEGSLNGIGSTCTQGTL